MRPQIQLLLSFVAVIFFLGCEGEKRKTKADRIAEDQYFNGAAVSSLSDLKNEIGDAPTDFLRLFKDDPIPWQAWNSSITDKARSCQAPILALVVSSLDGGCRDTALKICANKELLSLFKDNNVCTIIDIHANPEIGLLSYYLANEARQQIGFPMLIWMSHEASPIGWIPIENFKENNLKSVIENWALMVNQTWTESSDYAVINSRREAKNRQNRLDSMVPEAEKDINRNNLFFRKARQIVSLYDPISRSIDGAGGLVPSSALELLVKAYLSPQMPEGIRRRAREGISSVISAVEEGAIHDPLDSLYFYARRSQDWSLPAFSKDLGTQAQYASALIHCGQAINDPNLINSGTKIIKILKEDWLNNNYTNESSLLEKDVPGVFLWDWIALEKTLNPAEIKLAALLFNLKRSGNIPLVSDPTSKFFRLNNLSYPNDLQEIATSLSSTPEEIRLRLEKVINKLKEHREDTGAIFRETQVAAQDRAQFCLAQLANWTTTGSPFDLADAIASANVLRNEHRPDGKRLMRFPSSSKVRARGADYARAILAGVRIHQATLDPEWLKWSIALTHEALEHLSTEERPLIQETPTEDRVIPLHLYNSSMVFSESTLGLFDQAVSKIAALNEDEKITSLRNRLGRTLSTSCERLPIIHTDFISSCSLGNDPLVAVLSGQFENASFQALLREINAPEFISFIVIRDDHESKLLTPLPEFERPSTATGITLLRDEKIIGQASDIAEFRKLLQQALLQKE
jgi:uncharacterized protein YyaL (SSP411 family)